MRILDESGRELQEEELDFSLGYLIPDQVVKEHHDKIDEVEEKGHYYPETFYFTDGTEYKVNVEGEKDPCVQANDDGVSFTYVAPKGEEPREFKGCDVKYIIDVEYQEAKDAWDEMEDIQRYRLYTEEELQERKEQKEQQEKRERFMSTGPDRLDNAESNIDVVSTNVDDITMLLADMIGA